LSTHSELARELFGKRYNCAQSVFAAFCDETGMDFNKALKIAAPFGGGIGRLQEVCGAVSGMAMVIGMIYGYTDPSDDESKTEHYELVKGLVKQFEKENSSIICRELLSLSEKNNNPLPGDGHGGYYEKRPCAGIVEHAARILDEYILSKKREEKEIHA
jgi:C_GCAxxG_C_C family probable redox protein